LCGFDDDDVIPCKTFLPVWAQKVFKGGGSQKKQREKWDAVAKEGTIPSFGEHPKSSTLQNLRVVDGSVVLSPKCSV